MKYRRILKNLPILAVDGNLDNLELVKVIFGKDSGSRVLTKGTVEGEYHKYEPEPDSRTR